MSAVGRMFFPISPIRKKSPGFRMPGGTKLNRYLEALERAGISQARETPVSHPGIDWLLSALPTHLLQLIVGLGMWNPTGLVGK